MTVVQDERLHGWLNLLEAMGATEVRHIGDSLAGHLTGTYEILQRWECSDDLCAAGLFHSVYSTDHFETKTIPLYERPRVAAAIGERAERLAYIYCAIDRESLYENLNRGARFDLRDRWTGETIPIERAELAELLTLDVANNLELVPKLGWSESQRAGARRQYAKAAPFLPPQAVEELRTALDVGRTDMIAGRARRLLARVPVLRRLKRALRGS
jgi:hypothetical protein